MIDGFDVTDRFDVIDGFDVTDRFDVIDGFDVMLYCTYLMESIHL